MKTDLEIAQSNKMKPITTIAKQIGALKFIEAQGSYKAKFKSEKIYKQLSNPDGKLILVTAITPTKAGEGKSTTTIGLGDALTYLGKKTVIALREPSFGPVLGIKGGAAGGGYAQVMPMEDINMHFTGDMHAITMANNALSALIDNHLHQGNELNLNKDKIIWKRCLDLNDRALREVEVGFGNINGPVRKDGFNITVASEIMAILCLAKDIDDLKQRISEITIGYNMDDQPVTVKDLKCEGALTLILKDAIKPNLVQTLYHTPTIIHGGPFANIAHGCNSIIATKTAMKLGDYVVTEAGFGADLGAEKFLDIKCREAGIVPNAVVIVATIRALKMHGNAEDYNVPNLEALKRGIINLERHIKSIKRFNIPYVVCINKFLTDTDEEINYLYKWGVKHNHPIALSDVYSKGPEGGLELANKVLEACDKQNKYEPLYDLNSKIEHKIKKICQDIYGAKKVVYSELALAQLKECYKNGYEHFYICMAKTPNSVTDDPKIMGAPKNFDIHVKELRVSTGARFIVVLTGSIMTMPGLPKEPQALKMDIINGKAKGLF